MSKFRVTPQPRHRVHFDIVTENGNTQVSLDGVELPFNDIVFEQRHGEKPNIQVNIPIEDAEIYAGNESFSDKKGFWDWITRLCEKHAALYFALAIAGVVFLATITSVAIIFLVLMIKSL